MLSVGHVRNTVMSLCGYLEKGFELLVVIRKTVLCYLLSIFGREISFISCTSVEHGFEMLVVIRNKVLSYWLSFGTRF